MVSSSGYFIWNHARSEEYSVRSGYWLAEKEANKEAFVSGGFLPSLNGIKDLIWSTVSAPKIKIFLWKVISGVIPIADNLIERGMKVDSRCQICGLEGETLNHVLFTCTVAKQTWAESNFSHPEFGFDSSSVYSNILYVLKTKKNILIPEQIRRCGPWILWLIWRNRNSFLFEGKIALGPSFIKGCFEEDDRWSMIKTLDDQEKSIDLARKKKILFRWKPPPISWLKCDIASSWDKIIYKSVAAWILRNRQGKVLLHGRNSFTGIYSKHDAYLESWKWAIDCLKTLHFNAIVFASEDNDLIGAISKPSAWPSLKFYSSKMLPLLQCFLDWNVKFHAPNDIKGAKLIAYSVIKGNRYYSYIAVGIPHWLSHFFLVKALCLSFFVCM